MCVECVTLFPPILYSYIYYTYLPAPQPAILYNNKCYIALILQKKRLLHLLLRNKKTKTRSEEITK